MVARFFGKVSALFKKVMASGVSPARLALAVSLGIYIAFSPFPGLHTVMILSSSWLFGLNLPIMFMVASINNPWTMVPFYSLDYAFGYWLTHSVLGWNNTWQISLEKVFGSGSVCVWSFILGGNILGIVSALITYPIIKTVLERTSKRSL